MLQLRRRAALLLLASRSSKNSGPISPRSALFSALSRRSSSSRSALACRTSSRTYALTLESPRADGFLHELAQGFGSRLRAPPGHAARDRVLGKARSECRPVELGLLDTCGYRWSPVRSKAPDFPTRRGGRAAEGGGLDSRFALVACCTRIPGRLAAPLAWHGQVLRPHSRAHGRTWRHPRALLDAHTPAISKQPCRVGRRVASTSSLAGTSAQRALNEQICWRQSESDSGRGVVPTVLR